MREEDRLQKDIVKAARQLGFLVIRIKNEGKRTPKQTSHDKSMGMHVGCSDLVCISKKGLATFMEIKSAKGVLSKAQTEFGHAVGSLGFTYWVVRSYDEAIRYLRILEQEDAA